MSMIPDSIYQQQSQDWKQSLADSFREVRELLDYCQIDPAIYPLFSDTGFNLRVTRFYASLIEKGNPQDPLLLQVLPDPRELEQVQGYSLDPVGDLDSMPVPGLIHKYPGRVLLTLTSACAIHCRYCFRRHFPYTESNANYQSDSAIINYLQTHDEIYEVILSGGDPLIVSDEKLSRLIQSLNKIKHLKLLRIHSRLLSVLPERITQKLLQTLDTFNGLIVWVTHINHANEISPINQAVFRTISKHGHRIFNQSVLLRGINNNANILADLSFRLFDSSITPYYLHRLDKVQGSAHFDLDDSQSRKIYKQLTQSLPGYLLPKMVDEIAGQLSKSTVHCS